MANKKEKKRREGVSEVVQPSPIGNENIKMTPSHINKKKNIDEEDSDPQVEQFINMDNVHFDYLQDTASTVSGKKKKNKKKKKKSSNVSGNKNTKDNLSFSSSMSLSSQDSTFFNYLLAAGKAYADHQKQLCSNSQSKHSESQNISNSDNSRTGPNYSNDSVSVSDADQQLQSFSESNVSATLNESLVKLFSIPGIEETLAKSIRNASEIMKSHLSDNTNGQNNSAFSNKDSSVTPIINPEDSRFVDAIFQALESTASSQQQHAILTALSSTSSASTSISKDSKIPVETMKNFMAAVGKSIISNNNLPKEEESHTCVNCGNHNSPSEVFQEQGDHNEISNNEEHEKFNDDEYDDDYEEYEYDDDYDDDDDDYPTNRVIRQNEKGEVIVEEMFIENEHNSSNHYSAHNNNLNGKPQKLKSYKFSVPANAISKYLPHLDPNTSDRQSNVMESFHQQQQLSQKSKKKQKGLKSKQSNNISSNISNTSYHLDTGEKESSGVSQIDMGITSQKFGASNLEAEQLEEYWKLLSKDEKYKVLTFSIVKLRHTTKKTSITPQKSHQSLQQTETNDNGDSASDDIISNESLDNGNIQNKDSCKSYPSIDILLDQFIDKLLNFVKRQGIDSAFELLLNNNASLFDMNMAEEDLFKEMMQFAMMKDSEKSNPATSNKLYKSLFDMVESSPQMKTVLSDDFSYLANDLVSNQGKNFLQLMESVSLNSKSEEQQSQEKQDPETLYKQSGSTNEKINDTVNDIQSHESCVKSEDDPATHTLGEHSTSSKVENNTKTHDYCANTEVQSSMIEPLSSNLCDKSGDDIHSILACDNENDGENDDDKEEDDDDDDDGSFYNEAIKGYSENMLFAEKNIRSVYLAFVADNLYGIYKQRMADLKTQELLDELKKEEERKRLKEEKKEQDRIKRREKKKLIQQQKETERLRKEQERLLKEKLLKEEQKRKTEEGRKRKEEERKKREEEKRLAKKKQLEKKRLKEQELERQMKEKREKKEKEMQEKKKKLEDEKLRAKMSKLEKESMRKKQQEHALQQPSPDNLHFWNNMPSSSATANSNTIDEDDELLLKSAINGDLSVDIGDNTVVGSTVVGILPAEEINRNHISQPLASSSNFRSDSPFSDILTPTSQYSPSNNNSSNLNISGCAISDSIPYVATASAPRMMNSPSLLNLISSASQQQSQLSPANFATTSTSPFFDSGIFVNNAQTDMNSVNHTGSNSDVNNVPTSIWNQNEIPLASSFIPSSFSSNSFIQPQTSHQPSSESHITPQKQEIPSSHKQQVLHSQQSSVPQAPSQQLLIPECITKAYHDCFMNNFVAMQDLYHQTRRYLPSFQLLTFTDFMSIVTKMPNVEFLYDKFGNSTHMKIIGIDSAASTNTGNSGGFASHSFGVQSANSTQNVLMSNSGIINNGFHFGSSSSSNIGAGISQGSGGLNFNSIW